MYLAEILSPTSGPAFYVVLARLFYVYTASRRAKAPCFLCRTNEHSNKSYHPQDMVTGFVVRLKIIRH